MSIKHLAIGCALLGLGLASGPASAAVNVYDLGLLNTTVSSYGYLGEIIPNGKNYTYDYFEFQLAGPAFFTFSETDSITGKMKLLTSGALSLDSCASNCTGAAPGAPGLGTIIDSVSVTGSGTSQGAELGGATGVLLAGGDYFVELSGVFNNTKAVFAATSETVAAVPEASTWLMMLTGLAGLAFVGYRRAGKGSAARLAA